MGSVKGKVRIAETNDGWHGYIGRKVVTKFNNEFGAKSWLYDTLNPRQNYGKLVNPETGEHAENGKFWVKSVMGPWCQIDDRTPYTCSPSSETYWSS